MNRTIKGEERALEILEQALIKDKISGSYLFYGQDGVGKFASALTLAQAINCHATKEKRPCGVCVSCRKIANFTHPDLLHVFPFPKPDGNKADISVKGEIKTEKLLKEYEGYINNKRDTPWKDYFFSKNCGIRIASIRMLEHRIRLSPNEANKKIYIIENADQMTVQAANAFLKTLEEPPADTIIILTSSKPNSLLPTILSRCQKIPFHPINSNVIEQELLETRNISQIQAKLFSKIAGGSMAKAFCLSENDDSDIRESTLNLIKIMYKKDDLKFLEFSAQYGGKKTLSQLKEIISQLIIWISDISYLIHFPEAIVNLDQIDMLQNLYNLNPNIDEETPDLLEYLDLMLAKLDGHVSSQLVLVGVYNKIITAFHNI